MKQRLLISFLILLVGAGILGLVLSRKASETVPQETILSEKPSVFVELLKPIYEPPTKLKLATANIDLELVTVGVDDSGALETPKDWKQGGWYENGAKAGEAGNVIINAHYDTNYGGPAGFWTLRKAVVGDSVELTDALGRLYTYRVTQSFYVAINDPTRLSIFEEDKSKYELTLLTCGGVWDAGAHNYSKRLVVKAELMQDISSIAYTN